MKEIDRMTKVMADQTTEFGDHWRHHGVVIDEYTMENLSEDLIGAVHSPSFIEKCL
jgi:hypothetical protein